MAFGDFQGAVVEESAIAEVGKTLAEAQSAEQVLEVIDAQGPKLGYKVVGYLCRLIKRQYTPEQAAKVLKVGWTKANGIPSPFGKQDSDGPAKTAPATPAPVVVVIKTPEESYWDSLLA